MPTEVKVGFFFMLLDWRIAVEDVLSNLFEVSGKDSLIACSRE